MNINECRESGRKFLPIMPNIQNNCHLKQLYFIKNLYSDHTYYKQNKQNCAFIPEAWELTEKNGDDK